MRKWIFIGFLVLSATIIADDYMEWNWPVTDAPPEFPGGQKALLKYMSDSIHYPEEARKNHEEGQVVVQFVVDSLGNVCETAVYRSCGVPALDAEAVRVCQSMPRWKPAWRIVNYNTGERRTLRTRYTIPIHFRLPEDEQKDKTTIQ
ncbi:MAG: energy transducer TonB [Paludibacteraceae bacterium]|nr:energy transducer TonB [Paludibacteraceae bacterium]